MKNTAGIATTKKRKPENKIGGNSASPNLMTEKLSPQMNTTIKANEMLFTFTRQTPFNCTNYRFRVSNYWRKLSSMPEIQVSKALLPKPNSYHAIEE